MARKRKVLDIQLPSLSGGPSANKVIKNIRAISLLDLLYSGFRFEALFHQSQICTEMFMQANACKLMADYRSNKTYIQNKGRYNQGLNTLLVCIQLVFLQMRDS
jgi:hypothetical protein